MRRDIDDEIDERLARLEYERRHADHDEHREHVRNSRAARIEEEDDMRRELRDEARGQGR